MLTQKQKAVLLFIRQSVRQGLPPTIREIAQAFHFLPPARCAIICGHWRARGIFRFPGKKSRAIEVTEKAALNIPVLGQVPAGLPVLAVENIERYFNVDALFAQAG